MYKHTQNDALRVMVHHAKLLEKIDADNKEQASDADKAIQSSEALLNDLNMQAPLRSYHKRRDNNVHSGSYLRSWDEILAEAYRCTPDNVSFSDILSPKEIQEIISRHHNLEDEFSQLYSLDIYDWIVCGIAGILGGLIDIFLVKIPKYGSETSSGGWLSNIVRKKFGEILPEDKIRELERQFPVCYDLSTNNGLKENIPGLYPKTHRFQSPGHDPVLGWIFGVRDLLMGEFTAIGSDGTLIIQKACEPFIAGENIFIRIFEALRCVGGHLASDVSTAKGLPAPLMPLLLFLRTGSIGDKEHTIGEIARYMYLKNYDFRHFIATSIPVIIIEVIVRIAYFVRAVYKGSALAEAIPIANNPKLRSQLFIAHTVATSLNAGKVIVTQNPLSVSWAQWLAFFRYLLPQMHWLLIGKEKERSRYILKEINKDWKQLDEDISQIWQRTFSDEYKAIL